MQLITPMNRKNRPLVIALVMATIAGCGGNSGSTAPDTSNLTEAGLKSSLSTGLTAGITANSVAIARVLSNSAALRKVSGQDGGGAVSKTQKARAADGGAGPGADSSSAALDETFNVIDAIIEKSTVSQNGNIYTIDPNETSICADPQLELDATETVQCEDILEDMSVVVTVNAVTGDEVSAATSRFKYKGETFVETDFTPTTGYYQINLAGGKQLLADLMAISGADGGLPTTMSGSIRVAFSAPDENSGSMTLSIPQTVRIVNDAQGEKIIDVTVNRTDKLLAVSADANTTSLDLEVGFDALSVLFNDQDAAGSFPVELALKALTGKISLDDNGDTLQITGLGIDSLTLTVAGQNALTANLPKLDAVFDAAGDNAFVQFTQALDFTFDTLNVRTYLNDKGSVSDFTHLSVAAPAGTKLVEAGETAVQVASGGPLTIDFDDGENPATVTVPQGSCLDTDKLLAIGCPTNGG